MIDRSIAAKRNLPGFQYFYNIETPVGLGQANGRCSVLLVQYMLDVFLSAYGELVGLPRLRVDGVMGLETDQAIRAFQRWLQFSPHAGAVPESGILAPVRSALVEGPRGPFVPTVLLLNRVWASIRPETFLRPYLLGTCVGDDVAVSWWEQHPERMRGMELAATAEILL